MSSNGLGDNKEANTMTGFARGHNATFYCRFCRMTMQTAKLSTTEDPNSRRNRTNYEEDINYNDLHSRYD